MQDTRGGSQGHVTLRGQGDKAQREDDEEYKMSHTRERQGKSSHTMTGSKYTHGNIQGNK